MIKNVAFYVVVSTLLICVPLTNWVMAQVKPQDYLQDRGDGIAISMFGTYMQKGELLIYPYYEYYYDQDAEYKPSEFGFGVEQDFRGKYRAHEGLIFIGYGISDYLALEFEAAMIKAILYKADDDTSSMPGKLQESGMGDVESQLRWRLLKESRSHPELFGYFETVFPLQKDKVLIGTQDWEFMLGSGIIKGFALGTVTLRAAVAYITAESSVELGEYAVEYLKRLSNHLRIYAAVEGAQDEVELITEVQIFLTPCIFLKLNNGFGLTSKATDLAPEVGVMFSF